MPAVAFTASEIERAAKAARAGGMTVREVQIRKEPGGAVTVRVLSEPEDLPELVESPETEREEEPEPWE